MGLVDQIVGAESGGDPNATNPNSSATGAGQFLSGTWTSLLKQHRPELTAGRSDAEIAAMRSDPALSKQMVDAYAADNQAILAKNGLPVTPGTTYLSHFAGPGGAVKVLQADPNTPVADLLDPRAMKANPFLAGMTAQGLQAWAARKMGAQAPVIPNQPQAAPQQAAAPQPAPAPQAAASAPIFAGAALQQLAADPGAQAPGGPRAQPIFVPPRKAIDLTALRAALANRAPIFPNQGTG